MSTIRYGIIRTDTGGVESGACYPGCGPGNESACQGVSFPSLAAFQAHCAANQESGVVLGTADPNSPAWNALRNQAFALCAPTAPASAPVAAGAPLAGCCGGNTITAQPAGTTSTSPGIAALTGGNPPPAPFSPSSGASSFGPIAVTGPPPADAGPGERPVIPSLKEFFTSPVGIIIAFVVVFLLMGGHHSK